jgi:hypothetical protein
MPKSKWREFQCPVVHEAVMIRLRRNDGFDRRAPFFVQCNQTECQYVEKNEPPCPLHLSMFAEEIREIDRWRQAAQEERQ